MAEIIPSINAATFEEVQKKIALVESYVSWCHLDVTDGVFSKHPTWRDPYDLTRLRTRLKAEMHLMVEEPEKIVEQWLVEPIRRIIVHLEAAKNPELIIKNAALPDGKSDLPYGRTPRGRNSSRGAAKRICFCFFACRRARRAKKCHQSSLRKSGIYARRVRSV